jgi:hypothetical protein
LIKHAEFLLRGSKKKRVDLIPPARKTVKLKVACCPITFNLWATRAIGGKERGPIATA